MSDNSNDSELQAMRERNFLRQQKLDELQRVWADVWGSERSLGTKSKRAVELGDEINAVIWSMETPTNWEAELSPEKRLQMQQALGHADDLKAQMVAVIDTDWARFAELNEELDQWLSSNRHLFEF